MMKGASSKAARPEAVAGAGGAQEQYEAMIKMEHEQLERVKAELALLWATETEEQRASRQAEQLAFIKAALEEYQRCIAMGEEGVVEEYRQAGKLHTYDRDKERQKRFARIANLYPCQWPEHTLERIKEYTKYLEEDEDDYKIGLYALIEE